MKSYPKLSKKNQGGFTLIELMIGFAIIIAASVLIFNYANSAKVSAKVQAESGNVSAITGRIKNMYNSQPNFSTISNTVLIGAKAFPGQMVNGTAVTNSWGGNVTVAPATVNGVANAGYSITYASVPQAECSDLVAGLDSVFVQMSVNGVAVKNIYTPLALSMATLTGATACGLGDANSVVFTGIN